jgi:hypothetical protein
MTYTFLAWELVAENHRLKLQCLQNKVLRNTGKSPRCTSIRELHIAIQLLYMYYYITKLCRQQVEIIQNHENASVRDIGKGEALHRTYNRFKLGGGQV